MSGTGKGPRRYSDEEVSRLLKQATDLQTEEASPGGAGGAGMTLAEIQEIAAEVGIEPRYLQRAAAQIDRPSGPGLGEILAGGPLLVAVERIVPGELGEPDFARVVPRIQQAAVGHGNATMVGSTLTWSSETSGKQRTLQVTVASQDGETLIRAEERLHGMAGGLFGGLVGGAGVGVGVGVGLPLGLEVLGSGLFAALFPLGTVGLFYGIARAIMSKTTSNRRMILEGLVDEIAGQVPTAAAIAPPDRP